jgi:hypothetical protein
MKGASVKALPWCRLILCIIIGVTQVFEFCAIEKHLGRNYGMKRRYFATASAGGPCWQNPDDGLPDQTMAAALLFLRITGAQATQGQLANGGFSTLGQHPLCKCRL